MTDSHKDKIRRLLTGRKPIPAGNQQLLFTAHEDTAAEIDGTKFADGAPDGKHYWLTPPHLMDKLQARFEFTFDACPHPKPDGVDGLTNEWGSSTYVNPPFGSIMHNGKKKGPTAWARKAIQESETGKKVVMVYPLDKWVLMLLEAGAKVENLGDVKWCSTEDGKPGPGTGRHIAMFILDQQERRE